MSQVARRFSYEVTVNARPKLAWEVFSDWRRWHTFSNVYGRLEWIKGQPWTVGSRLSIEVLRPVHTIIDHVITHCEPAERVGWLDHALGITIEQWVSFEAKNGSGTLVRVTGDIVGSELDLNGISLQQFFQDFTRDWYEAYREVCNQLAPIA